MTFSEILFIGGGKDLPGLHLRLVGAWDGLPSLPDAYGLAVGRVSLGERLGRKDDLTTAPARISTIYRRKLPPPIRTR